LTKFDSEADKEAYQKFGKS